MVRAGRKREEGWEKLVEEDDTRSSLHFASVVQHPMIIALLMVKIRFEARRFPDSFFFNAFCRG